MVQIRCGHKVVRLDLDPECLTLEFLKEFFVGFFKLKNLADNKKACKITKHVGKL